MGFVIECTHTSASQHRKHSAKGSLHGPLLAILQGSSVRTGFKKDFTPTNGHDVRRIEKFRWQQLGYSQYIW